ncbi:MAG: peptide-binding protein [Hyphomicrobiales bacterium]|nr:peptide-binding protein [Hyphomicrobiales bacterium]
MRFLAAPLFAAALFAAAPTAAFAEDGSHCVVADPTGTQLNVRESPNGRIVGSIANGVWVWVRTRAEVRGKTWAYIHDSDMVAHIGDPLGWVFDAYLKCM